MHTRRMATFLLGIWLGCTVLMGWIALEDSSLSSAAGGPLVTAQNRLHFYNWEEAQFVLGLVLGICLFLGTQKRVAPLICCGFMLLLVLFEHLNLMPELIAQGHEVDLSTSERITNVRMHPLNLNRIYGGVEGVKFLIGGFLASYLFVFRTKQRVRKTADEAVSIRRGPSEPHR
jgi:hypothetical protein